MFAHTDLLCLRTSIRAGDYDIQVSPGQDVILYLALAVCIDKMHHEATRK